MLSSNNNKTKKHRHFSPVFFLSATAGSVQLRATARQTAERYAALWRNASQSAQRTVLTYYHIASCAANCFFKSFAVFRSALLLANDFLKKIIARTKRTRSTSANELENLSVLGVPPGSIVCQRVTKDLNFKSVMFCNILIVNITSDYPESDSYITALITICCAALWRNAPHASRAWM
mgnify:CR=1 FL=1